MTRCPNAPQADDECPCDDCTRKRRDGPKRRNCLTATLEFALPVSAIIAVVIWWALT